MNNRELQAALRDLPLGGFRFFESIGSTNDEALSWASQGANDLSIVIADEQTGGRGRLGRKWITSPRASLAFSLILRPTPEETKYPGRVTGLGALAMTDSISRLGLHAQIKWPNDVLLDGKKTAGILVESTWTSDKPDAFVLGLGINVLVPSVPAPDQVLFPATSLETELGRTIDRTQLLHHILFSTLDWRSRLGSDEFVKAWESSLAFRGAEIQLIKDNQAPLKGRLLGLESNGGLRLMVNDKILTVQIGEIHLRAAL
ncbi:MAG TPA: biotin--[acetyl-CoA-carboxylase] ligase [Anaerolineales bacterium]|nr:biotin--[acetyl-CoA-carboxylase] ligase [Anaerolineales bacterium]